MKRLRLGAVLHFLIAIGHIGCLFALDEAFEVYGIREIMHQMVSGQVWMLYALTIGLVLAFCLAGLYALSATGGCAYFDTPSLLAVRHRIKQNIPYIWCITRHESVRRRWRRSP